MNPYDAIDALDALEVGDNEEVHRDADEILFQVVRVFAPDVAAAYERVRQRVTFWYA